MGNSVKARESLPEVRFDNPRLTSLGIEPMRMAELRDKVALKSPGQPERVDFFILMLVTEGNGVHTVDFVDWPLTPGQMLFIQPGQVQQWHLEEPFDALMILIDPGALPQSIGQASCRELGLLGFDEWHAAHMLVDDDYHAIEASFRQIRQDFDRFTGESLDIALIRHEVMALLTRIAKLQTQTRDQLAIIATARQTYRLFIQALESGFTETRSLHHYARRLGYSESTITRACIASEGRTAKAIISRRVLLEAKRLLAHSTASVSTVAYQLGFSEATNFVKFFRKHAGVTPKDFRASMLGRG